MRELTFCLIIKIEASAYMEKFHLHFVMFSLKLKYLHIHRILFLLWVTYNLGRSISNDVFVEQPMAWVCQKFSRKTFKALLALV